MSEVRRLRPLLTATHRYDKSISTWKRGEGVLIDAPILAYLIETRNGRVLYDVGCDYSKIRLEDLRERYYDPAVNHFGAPRMTEEQRIPYHLKRLGLSPRDVDLIVIGHLHFDHAGGLKELRQEGCAAEIHVHRDEVAAARTGADTSVFQDDLVDEASGSPNEIVTVSIGIAALDPGAVAGADTLVGRADRALYRAKQAGRNRVIAEG